MVSSPLIGREAAHGGCKLVGHLADRAEVGLVDDTVKRIYFEFHLHHFGDGDHCCRGRHDGFSAIRKC